MNARQEAALRTSATPSTVHAEPNDENSRLQVYDLTKNTAHPALIKNVAYSKGFYNADINGRTETLEAWFNKNIETPAGAALDRLIESQKILDLSVDDRLNIARFVATLAVRGRLVREEIENFPRLLLNHIEAQGNRIADELKAKLQTDDSGPGIHNALIQRISQIAPALVQMGWRLARPPQGREFCSSDNPVVRFNPMNFNPYGNVGLLCRGIQLQLAISPALLLLIADPLVYGMSSNAIDLMSEDNLLHYNGLLAGWARQFLFSRSGDFDVREGMYSGGIRMTIE